MKPESPKQQKHQMPYALLALLLSLDVIVFLLQKLASQHAAGRGISFFASLGLEWRTWLALGLGPVQLLLWTRILARIDISVAYPLTSLAYPLTLLCAEFFLGESLDRQVWIGAMMITAGAAIIGYSKERAIEINSNRTPNQ